eukprot:7731645-Pyramimonas_sp.AAC.1
MQSPPFTLTLASALALSPECPSDSAPCLANWLLHKSLPPACAGMSKLSSAVASSSEDVSVPIPESKSDSAGCPAKPVRVAAGVGAAASGGPRNVAQESCDPEAGPPL